MLGSASEAAAMCALLAETDERSVRSFWGFFFVVGAFKAVVDLGFREGSEGPVSVPKLLISSTTASSFALVGATLSSSSSSSNTALLVGAGAVFLRFSPYFNDMFVRVDLISVR